MKKVFATTKLASVAVALLFGFLSLFAAQTAAAQAVDQVANIAALTASTSGAAGISVAGYNTAGDGGGGIFALVTTCTTNAGTCFTDGLGNHYLRQKPRWDVAEWGIFGDGTTNQSSVIAAMFTAASNAKVNTVTVANNGAFLFNTGLSIPANMALHCLNAHSDLPVDMSNLPNGDHKDIPFLLLIPSNQTISLSASTSTSSSGGTIDGCNVENSDVYATANPTSNMCCYQQLVTITNAFGGTGVTCAGDGCTFRHGMIMGFTTGFTATSVDTVNIEDVRVDATNCYDLVSSHLVEGQFHNFGCYSLLTAELHAGLQYLPIQSVTNNAGKYQITLYTACVDSTNNCPRTGDKVWIGRDQMGNPITGAESLAGFCTYSRIDDSNGTCTNSQTAASVATGSTTAGSTEITGFTATGALKYVRKDQAVSGTGIPLGATVVAVWPRQHIVWISAAATATGSVSVTFTDNGYSPPDSDHAYALRPFANYRDGVGLKVDGTANFKFSNCEVYTHQIAFQLIDGAANNSFTGCAAEDETADLDSNHIGLDIEDASKTNSWYGGAIHYGANQSVVVLNNQIPPMGGTLGANYLYIPDTGSNQDATATLDNEAGNLVASISAGTDTSDIFVADGTRNLVLLNAIQLNTTVWYQSATAFTNTQGSHDLLNVGAPPFVTSFLSGVTAHPGGGQTNAVLLTGQVASIASVATDGDSVALMPATAGACQTVTNSGNHIAAVFAALGTSDTINGVAGSTGVVLGTGQTAQFCAAHDGKWTAFIPLTVPLTASTQTDRVGTTTPTSVAGLITDVAAGHTYNFDVQLFVNADMTGGIRTRMGGTNTASSIIYHVEYQCDVTTGFVAMATLTNQTTQTGVAACAAGIMHLKGSIVVSAGGTLTPQISQVTGTGTSSALIGSTATYTQVN
jgi:hypothetical protein